MVARTRNTHAVQVSPMVQVPIFGEDERLIPFSELAEQSGQDPATVSDTQLIELVVGHMDLANVEALKLRIMGAHYNADRDLKVSRPATGHILIAPSAELGYDEDAGLDDSDTQPEEDDVAVPA